MFRQLFNRYTETEKTESKLETKTERKTSNKPVQRLPVDRDYDFDAHVPENVPEYKQHDDELDRIMHDLNHRKDHKRLPRFLIGGPTGCGKTNLAKFIAQEREIPVITVQGRYSMDESDLLGHPILIDDETVWSDGPLTKALLASQEREVMLLIDEANRARPESKGTLFSALDGRCQVELDARGGETIKGNADNLIVIATINEGQEYHVQDLDAAEKRRFGNKWNVDYLGKNHPEEETILLVERTPISRLVAEKLVQAANEIRRQADSNDSPINTGVPTSNVISWAQTAYTYQQEGVDNPVVEAALDSVVKPLYTSDRVFEEVKNIILDHCDGAPYKEEEFKEWMHEDNRE